MLSLMSVLLLNLVGTVSLYARVLTQHSRHDPKTLGQASYASPCCLSVSVHLALVCSPKMQVFLGMFRRDSGPVGQDFDVYVGMMRVRKKKYASENCLILISNCSFGTFE